MIYVYKYTYMSLTTLDFSAQQTHIKCKASKPTAQLSSHPYSVVVAINVIGDASSVLRKSVDSHTL